MGFKKRKNRPGKKVKKVPLNKLSKGWKKQKLSGVALRYLAELPPPKPQPKQEPKKKVEVQDVPMDSELVTISNVSLKKPAIESGSEQSEHKPIAPPKKSTKTKTFMPYKVDKRILLVGEGNFSFAHSLVELLGTGANVVATGFDSEKIMAEKYDDAAEHIEAVIEAGGEVLHQVDATKLATTKKLDTYDTVVFNFPHTGSGIKDQLRNIHQNQEMIVKFLTNAAAILNPGGEIHLTVKRGEPYDSWQVVRLGTKTANLKLKNSFNFDPSVYPHYVHRRTLGFKTGVSAENNEEIVKNGAKTYIFALRPEAVQADDE
eukprot:Colp12_sorted_trinity150504_noHs@32501